MSPLTGENAGRSRQFLHRLGTPVRWCSAVKSLHPWRFTRGGALA
jgi:hypothetical protein